VPAAIFRSVAVLGVDHGLSVGESGQVGERLLAVVGMDELDEPTAQEFRILVAEKSLERRVHALEVAIRVGDAEKVERQLEHATEAIRALAVIIVLTHPDSVLCGEPGHVGVGGGAAGHVGRNDLEKLRVGNIFT